VSAGAPTVVGGGKWREGVRGGECRGGKREKEGAAGDDRKNNGSGGDAVAAAAGKGGRVFEAEPSHVGLPRSAGELGVASSITRCLSRAF